MHLDDRSPRIVGNRPTEHATGTSDRRPGQDTPGVTSGEARETLTVGFLDRAVAVRSEVAGLVPWLREALLPSFEKRDFSGAGAELVAHPARDAGGLPDGHEASWPCYALGERVVWLPGRRTDSTILVEDSHYGTRFTVGARRVEIRPYAPPERIRVATFRAVRELVVAPRGAPGRVELHAAALEIDGRVIAFSGPKGAGKTTTLARAATAVEAGVVTNDRLLIVRTGSGFHARGIPTAVSVRADTVARLPSVFGGLEYRERRFDRSLAELRALPPGAGGIASLPHRLTLTHFADILGAPLHAGGPLACIAFVSVDPRAGTFTINRLGGAELAHRIGESFRIDEANRPPTVFERCLGYETIAGDDPALPAELAELVPCLEIRVGQRFLGDARHARDLVARLVEAT